MQVSSQKLDPLLEKELEKQLITVIAELKKVQEAKTFFDNFFTPTEQKVLVKRLAIAVLLKKKLSYEAIKSTLKVSSATISFVAESLQTPGIQLALQKLDDEQWAEQQLGKWFKFLK